MFRRGPFKHRGANVDGYGAKSPPIGFGPGLRADLSRTYGVTGNREDAEDILQAVFLRLMSREFPPDFEKNPKGYLYRTAVNRSLDVIEARRRRPQPLEVAPVMEVTELAEDP